MHKAVDKVCLAIGITKWSGTAIPIASIVDRFIRLLWRRFFVSIIELRKKEIMSSLTGTCPICDAANQLPADTQQTEIITCCDCDNRLVVSSIADTQAILEEAPAIEEDWGE